MTNKIFIRKSDDSIVLPNNSHIWIPFKFDSRNNHFYIPNKNYNVENIGINPKEHLYGHSFSFNRGVQSQGFAGVLTDICRYQPYIQKCISYFNKYHFDKVKIPDERKKRLEGIVNHDREAYYVVQDTNVDALLQIKGSAIILDNETIDFMRKGFSGNSVKGDDFKKSTMGDIFIQYVKDNPRA